MKKVLMMFVMSFTLLVSCSYALEFNSVPYPEACTYTLFTATEDKNDFINTFQSETGYTPDQIRSISEYKSSSDSELLSAYTTAMNTLSAKGYHYVYGYRNGAICLLVKTSERIDIGYFKYNSYPYTAFLLNEGDLIYRFGSSEQLFSFDSSGLFIFQYVSTYHNSKVKNLTDDQRYVWTSSQGYKFEPTLCNAVGEVSSGGDSSYTPTFSDDEIAGVVNTFINSEDFITYRSSGYDDFFITYDNRAEQYYAYLYKSAYDLSMVYGTFDENGNFEPNGLSEGEGYNIFCSSDSSNFLSDLWSNIKRIFQPSQYLCFRINSVINKVHYIATYSDNTMFKTSQMIFTTSERSIVYSTKDIKLIVRDGENTLVDTDNSYTKDVLIDSSTGEEYQFELPSTPVSETPWERFVSAITSIPKSILDGLKSLFVPDLSYLNSTWEKFKEKVGFIGQAKNVVNDITNSIELNPLEPPSITIDLTKANSKYDWGTSSIVLDLSWYVPYKPAVDFIIICFSYGFFFWNLFRKLPDIINGVSGDVPMMSYQAERVSNNSKRERIGF